MGVSGSGKTTIAQGIAARTGLVYGEADAFHPPGNVAKMSAGIPLEDADRWPWLRALAAWMAQQAAQGVSTVLACSALKRAYRDVLRAGVPDGRDAHAVQFVHLDGSSQLIRQRMAHRSGHFMPVGLLRSQLDDLQPLDEDEDGLILDASEPADELVARAVAALGLPTLSP
jgi:carbohydrate kinase, thermoresistant glucokinase family